MFFSQMTGVRFIILLINNHSVNVCIYIYVWLIFCFKSLVIKSNVYYTKSDLAVHMTNDPSHSHSVRHPTYHIILHYAWIWTPVNYGLLVKFTLTSTATPEGSNIKTTTTTTPKNYPTKKTRTQFNIFICRHIREVRYWCCCGRCLRQ